MRNCLLLLLASGALQAAIIKGTVVENQSGKPLARTLVALTPVPGSPGASVSARTNTYGSFEFTGLPAGSYLLHASRRGFMPVQYGQKNWRASGTPIVLDADQSTFLYVRLPRFASISGIVVDENDVGLPEHEIAAYRNTRPPRLVARAQADDRGIYRIFGLEPGNYLVRTIGRQYEDGGYLPTFYHETQRVEEAGFVETYLDQDRPEIKVRPIPGKLFNISGSVDSYGPPLMVTLVSDVGRESVTTTGAFQFPAHPPGPYELYVEAPSDRRGNQSYGAYLAFSLERDMTNMRVPLIPMPGITFQFQGVEGPIDAAGFKVLSKRIDLAGEAPPDPLKLINGAATVLPGRYLLSFAPNAAYVPMDFRGCRGERPEGGRADGWVEVAVLRPCGNRYVVSTKPGGVHGVVTGGAHDPIAGAPVFLEPYDEVTRKRVVDLRCAISDIHGKFQFYGLVPGTYRLVSTFEYQSPETADIDMMTPKIIKVEEGRDQQQDTDLFVIR
uniref:Cna B domain protein n=1 Tax=Solibacter usitatus (strain Ellin6076) TaxID=234267 RepID=Q023Y8_SOLUE